MKWRLQLSSPALPCVDACRVHNSASSSAPRCDHAKKRHDVNKARMAQSLAAFGSYRTSRRLCSACGRGGQKVNNECNDSDGSGNTHARDRQTPGLTATATYIRKEMRGGRLAEGMVRRKPYAGAWHNICRQPASLPSIQAIAHARFFLQLLLYPISLWWAKALVLLLPEPSPGRMMGDPPPFSTPLFFPCLTSRLWLPHLAWAVRPIILHGPAVSSRHLICHHQQRSCCCRANASILGIDGVEVRSKQRGSIGKSDTTSC
ncbi:hypothetical protein LY78DRAFT_313096 [Colletotrichum sublineola]|nr:hypothetical protein LY78DRAFT_313096 [Colletotrichum sublineola]